MAFLKKTTVNLLATSLKFDTKYELKKFNATIFSIYLTIFKIFSEDNLQI